MPSLMSFAFGTGLLSRASALAR